MLLKNFKLFFICSRKSMHRISIITSYYFPFVSRLPSTYIPFIHLSLLSVWQRHQQHSWYCKVSQTIANSLHWVDLQPGCRNSAIKNTNILTIFFWKIALKIQRIQTATYLKMKNKVMLYDNTFGIKKNSFTRYEYLTGSIVASRQLGHYGRISIFY